MAAAKFKNQNTTKVFLFFLMFSSLLWVLTKFSKQYSSNVNVHLAYQNLPENTLLSNAPKSISVNYLANGFEFIYYRIKPPTVELNLNKYYNDEANNVLIDRQALEIEISRDLDREVLLSNASIKQLEVELDHIANKEVPILIDAELELQNGFRQVDTIQIEPTKVIVSAPSQVLDSIDYIYTEKWVARNINKNQVKKLKLKTPKFEKTFLDLDAITATIQVAEYTQKNLKIPITLINKPDNITLMLIPEEISLMVDVDIDRFNEISEEDFEVVCDYTKRNEEDGILYARLKTSSEHAYNVKLSEVEIDYLIFK